MFYIMQHIKEIFHRKHLTLTIHQHCSTRKIIMEVTRWGTAAASLVSVSMVLVALDKEGWPEGLMRHHQGADSGMQEGHGVIWGYKQERLRRRSLLLRGFFYLICQLIGLPPENGRQRAASRCGHGNARAVWKEAEHSVKEVEGGDCRRRRYCMASVDWSRRYLKIALTLERLRTSERGRKITTCWASARGVMLRVGYQSYVYKLPCTTQVQSEAV